MIRILATALVAALLAACGSSGGGHDHATPGMASGSFVDAPVAGLGYRSGDGAGLTDADGGFDAAGRIDFLLGDIALGSAPAADFLTPVDLVPGAAAEDDPAANRAVTNLIRLLQTLDADGNARNGLQIDAAARSAGAGRTLIFDRPVADFAADPGLQDYLCAVRTARGGDCPQGGIELVPAEQARAHLRRTLGHIAQYGAPNRLPSADAGPDRDVVSGNEVILDGGASSDPDPRPQTQRPIAAYAWRQVSGPMVDLAEGDDPAVRRFTPQVAGEAVLVFELTVTDDDGDQRSDSVTVNVAPAGDDGGGGDGGGANTPPVADAAQFTVLAGRRLSDAVTASDADGDDLALAVVDGPGHGALDFKPDGSFTYTPEADFTGADAFTFQANDGAADSNTATAAITVRPLPVAQLLAGAAKRVVTPQQEHIDGVEEARLGGAGHLQQFNLGGFGIDPLQNFPDPIGGFGSQLTEPAGERVRTTDDGPENTWVRVFALSRRDASGHDTDVLFITLDAVGAGNLIQQGLKQAVSEATGVAPANILFGQTHSHAGADLQGLWGGVPASWIDDPVEHDGLYQLAAAAAAEAMQSQRPARLSVSARELPQFNSYRRPQVKTGSQADATATLLQARAVDDEAVIASLLQYNAHPTNIGPDAYNDAPNLDARAPHPDYVLATERTLEAEGGVALYYNGVIADAAPAGPTGDNAYETARLRGDAIGQAAAAGASQARVLADALQVRHVEAVLPVTNPVFLAAGAAGSFNRYYDFLDLPLAQLPVIGDLLGPELPNLPQATATATTTVSRITIGGATDGLEIVTLPGEGTNTFGQYIQHLAAAPNVMLLGLTHNSFGYIIPEEEFSYINETGEAGFTLPFTNYEEYVSLGPLTAPLLRLEAYNPLFDAPPEANLPPSLAACLGVDAGDECILTDILARPGYIQRGLAARCRENGLPEEFCSLLEPETGGQLADTCRANALPEAICNLLDLGGLLGGDAAPGGDPAPLDPGLLATAVDASLRGCDVLDPAHCMLPFPSDHFTTDAAPGSFQSVAAGGTGKRININILGMPRDIAGKPVDPTEWNRNDGFSPGQMIVTVVPGLAYDHQSGAVAGAAPITDIGQSLFDEDTSVMVIDADTGERHLVWAEMDLNASYLLPPQQIASPAPRPPALLVRPAKNFEEGHRYIVVLRDMRDAAGGLIAANPAFAACRDRTSILLPVVTKRCAELEENVFAPLAAIAADNPLVDVARDDSLFLAWDFTVASTHNLTARLLHMRDDAFAALDGGVPAFTVDTITEHPNDLVSRRIEGTFTVPSYLVLPDSTPVDTAPLETVLDQAQSLLPEAAGTLFDGIDLVAGAALPPNRLYYDPSDGPNGLYGDGLPDRTGDLTVDYICNVPRSAVADFDSAQPGAVHPARPSLYGHGLLGSATEVNNTDHVATMGAAHDILYCATDWYGFASPDVPNVLTALVDLSLFPLVPDGSQQGMLNFMYLARLLHDPAGFAADPAFRAAGVPVFDPGHVYYDGNSQGGILGGAVVATAPDIERGVLGVPGMNYSTLLRRSQDFDTYALPMDLAYTNTLDRSFLLSFIQMLWDRSENDGYAAHLNHHPLPGLNGAPMATRRVLLHPAFGDHQVSMWTADVLARTMLAAADGSRVDRHPDTVPFAFLDPIEQGYATDPATGLRRYDGSALVIWDQPWSGAVSDRCVDQTTPVPPTGNRPPRAGDDPHECPRREVAAQCQKSHFLRPDGAVIDVGGVESRTDCPAPAR